MHEKRSKEGAKRRQRGGKEGAKRGIKTSKKERES